MTRREGFWLPSIQSLCLSPIISISETPNFPKSEVTHHRSSQTQKHSQQTWTTAATSGGFWACWRLSVSSLSPPPPLSLNPPTSPHVPWTSTSFSESHGTPQIATTSSHRAAPATTAKPHVALLSSASLQSHSLNTSKRPPSFGSRMSPPPNPVSSIFNPSSPLFSCPTTSPPLALILSGSWLDPTYVPVCRTSLTGWRSSAAPPPSTATAGRISVSWRHATPVWKLGSRCNPSWFRLMVTSLIVKIAFISRFCMPLALWMKLGLRVMVQCRVYWQYLWILMWGLRIRAIRLWFLGWQGWVLLYWWCPACWGCTFGGRESGGRRVRGVIQGFSEWIWRIWEGLGRGLGRILAQSGSKFRTLRGRPTIFRRRISLGEGGVVLFTRGL